ncbi:unnamed protein product [Adineta steineri]|uniref:Uncharacterized protein n=1 Tax=Adineta steineri TaxID=433720 RepID=A0A815GVZ4_9BILA|nr:unnamed protein product [Adineta steineri]CAF3485030.1 unnamed protein product [Adineta steineri]
MPAYFTHFLQSNTQEIFADSLSNSQNEEVRHWKQGDNKGELVVGGNGKGNQSNQLTCPASLSFDNEENRYVVDNGNDGIQKYEKFSN